LNAKAILGSLLQRGRFVGLSVRGRLIFLFLFRDYEINEVDEGRLWNLIRGVVFGMACLRYETGL